MPDYLTLAYEGNYVGRGGLSLEYFTYQGQLWVINYEADAICPANWAW